MCAAAPSNASSTPFAKQSCRPVFAPAAYEKGVSVEQGWLPCRTLFAGIDSSSAYPLKVSKNGSNPFLHTS